MGMIFDGTTSEVINSLAPMITERIPEATADNLAEIGDIILSNANIANQFLNALVNRIASVVISSRLYENPLAPFKRATERYGDITEEIYVNIANAHEFDPRIAEDEVYKREIPNVSAFFHQMNSQLFYKVTISDDELRRAFTGENGVQYLIAKIVDSLYSGANYDEFLSMKNIFSVSRGEAGYIVTEQPSKTTIADIATQIKAASNLLPFMSDKYNAVGVQNFTPKERQILFVRADVDSIMDVELLAVAFNMDKAQFMGRRILVDNFGEGNEDVYAVLADEEWLLVRTNLEKFTEEYNAQGLYWNYFFHRWNTYSRSPFANAIYFTYGEVTAPTALEVNGAGTKVAKGSSYLMSVSVTPSTATVKGVKWAASSTDLDSGTYITSTGFLKIGKHQSADVVITAASLADDTVTATINWVAETETLTASV